VLPDIPAGLPEDFAGFLGAVAAAADSALSEDTP
jgi:hypothetical protein